MSYQQAIEYLMNIPMFQNIGAEAYNPSLDTITALAKELGDPQRKFMSIHVAGTNGKGSVSNLIASVLSAKGLKTALFTSPHLLDFRERMKIDNRMISKEDVTQFIEEKQELLDRLHPSFFEVTTAMAFWWFAKEDVDIAVVECGLGGRLDATNIVNPILSIVTNISNDHQSILGDSLPAIAREKGGIIKQFTPLVVGEWDNESSMELLSIAKEKESSSFIASQRYLPLGAEIIGNLQHIRYLSLLEDQEIELKTNLLGAYQAKNIATALTALDILNENSKIDITPDDIERGFTNCPLQARWQLLSKEPKIVCDTGHNEAGIAEVVAQLGRESYNELYFVLGVVADKEIDKILALLPKDAIYIFTKSSVNRALPSEELQKRSEKYNLKGVTTQTVKEAVEYCKNIAKTNDLIFIGGSCFTVADALK